MDHKFVSIIIWQQLVGHKLHLFSLWLDKVTNSWITWNYFIPFQTVQLANLYGHFVVVDVFLVYDVAGGLSVEHVAVVLLLF